MITTLSQFFDDARPHVATFNDWVTKYKPEATADHICFKCASTEEFESIRAMFEPQSGFIYQSIISKRRIAVIKLPAAIKTELGEIHFLELSDQKPDGSQLSGFDHIEIFPHKGTSNDLAAELESKSIHFEKVIRPHHTTFDTNIKADFKVRLEDEPLILKIKREEFI